MIKKLLIFLFSIYAICALISCSPEKRLTRLVKNNPFLADTIFVTKTITTPQIIVDTFFLASENTTDLLNIIDQYKNDIDSLTRKKLHSQITDYVVNRNCIDDTLSIKIGEDGLCKVWQYKSRFYYKLKIPQKKHVFTNPGLIVKPKIVTYSWGMFAAGILMGWLLLFLIIQFFKTR